MWQDTRDFYEVLPDIFQLVPAVLLGEAAVAGAPNLSDRSQIHLARV